MKAAKETEKSTSDFSAKSTPISTNDIPYGFEDQVLQEVRNNRVWTQDPKYFKSVLVSPSATMKMLNHAHSGVENGIRAGGKPVEVMGLILGRPSLGKERDGTDLRTLIVTDCFPLPIEGAETRVLADDAEVINYMISLGEAVEQTRKEKFMGWYHSHPFDVEIHSHCFLSSTDVSTQLQWQRSEDPHGNPWLAIVIDPLRSLSKKRPEMGAFRVYPPEYLAPVDETPDGRIVSDDASRIERWGSCWNRYYELQVDHFISSLGSQIVQVLTEEVLWMRTLSTNKMQETENRDRFSERIQMLANKLDGCLVQLNTQKRSSRVNETFLSEKQKASSENLEESVLEKVTEAAKDLSLEITHTQMLQLTKKCLFNSE
uniref:COP9 signalosome complex subunit 5 putative n=1 Tax=Albugo laibachii Nc14 TaxID=890382 RepID=F0WAF7_9STRA|nr:COP9 signalosome complex subunit 5 putative [Albugo laibachii Nc14]|eukprot:CCA18128.1 COP9 signalosome complex subunit 5 putative [Albugo laibachii Nc14]